MSGFKFLFIGGEGEVYPIPASKGSAYKAVPRLANESVLVVELFYETENRKPWRLIYVGFDRVQLDGHGQYIDKDTIAAGRRHTVGLKSDGTVTAVGDNNYGQCDVSGWCDIESTFIMDKNRY